MSCVNIRGCCIGEGRPKVILCLLYTSLPRFYPVAVPLQSGADQLAEL